MKRRLDTLRAVALAALTATLAAISACGPVPEGPEPRYRLPYDAGESHLVSQGEFHPFSHAQSYAIDFAMVQGTRILAARAGVVVRVRQDCPDVNCPFSPRTCCGNLVEIEHEDGSRARYLHLRPGGACVAVGDFVNQGDVIALSGNTGRSLAPHLHFEVHAPRGVVGTGRHGPSRDGTMEVRFADVPGGTLPWLRPVTSGNARGQDLCAAGGGR